MAALSGPKAVEDAAIEWVMGLERAAGGDRATPVMRARLLTSSRRPG
jgi:hypothetical protein